MSRFGFGIGGGGPTIQRSAEFLNDHVGRHYAQTFCGVAALLRERKIVLQARDARADDARRWLEAFGPDFNGWPLALSLPREA